MPFKDDAFEFLDSHIREIKYLSYGLGLCGVILITRELHLIKTFTRVSEIPQKFLKAHTTLQGQVLHVDAIGMLHVKHKPVINVPFSRRLKQVLRPQNQSDLLPVQLLGVEMTEPGIQWLTENVLNQHVWFKLVRAEEDTVFCSVHKTKNVFFKMNINKELIQNGLCKVLPPEPDFFRSDKFIIKFFTKLHEAESIAKKKKIGVWSNTSDSEAWTSMWKAMSERIARWNRARWNRTRSR